MGIPVSGRPIVWEEMVVTRHEGGLIAEEWGLSDMCRAHAGDVDADGAMSEEALPRPTRKPTLMGSAASVGRGRGYHVIGGSEADTMQGERVRPYGAMGGPWTATVRRPPWPRFYLALAPTRSYCSGHTSGESPRRSPLPQRRAPPSHRVHSCFRGVRFAVPSASDRHRLGSRQPHFGLPRAGGGILCGRRRDPTSPQHGVDRGTRRVGPGFLALRSGTVPHRSGEGPGHPTLLGRDAPPGGGVRHRRPAVRSHRAVRRARRVAGAASDPRGARGGGSRGLRR